jgi:hypothetical protein
MGFHLSAQFVRYAIVGVLGVFIGGAGGVFAAALIPDANGVIHGCYDNKTGALRVVDSAANCSKNQVPIEWNQRGVAGATGATGPTGATGATGRGVTSLNDLNGLPCGTTNSGTTRVVYGSGGAVSLFCDGLGDTTPPTVTDAHVLNNVGTTDFAEPDDAFSLTFSEEMNGNTAGTINVQDQDGTTATIRCTVDAACTWNAALTTLTVTLTSSLSNDAGTTPGLQIPMNVTAFGDFTDTAGNAPDVLGSEDRFIDYE